MRFPVNIQSAYEGYRGDIDTGFANGSIVRCERALSRLGPRDKFGHLPDKRVDLMDVGNLRTCNTRPLSPAAKKIVEYFARVKSVVHFLELGHGSGTGCFDAFCISKNVQIDAVGLTPVSPLIAVRDTAIQIVEALPGILRRNGVDGHLLALLQDAANSHDYDDQYSARVPLDAVLQLQRDGRAQFFEHTDPPYIRRQYIGRFPGKVSLTEDYYDVVYESHGPLAKSADDFESEKIVGAVCRVLDKEGIFVVRGSRAFASGKFFNNGSGVFVLGWDFSKGENMESIMVKQGSRFAQLIALMGLQKAAHLGEDVYTAKSLDAVLDEILS